MKKIVLGIFAMAVILLVVLVVYRDAEELGWQTWYDETQFYIQKTGIGLAMVSKISSEAVVEASKAVKAKDVEEAKDILSRASYKLFEVVKAADQLSVPKELAIYHKRMRSAFGIARQAIESIFNSKRDVTGYDTDAYRVLAVRSAIAAMEELKRVAKTRGAPANVIAKLDDTIADFSEKIAGKKTDLPGKYQVSDERYDIAGALEKANLRKKKKKSPYGPLPEVELCKPQEDGAHWIVSYRNAEGNACEADKKCDSVVYSCREKSEPVEMVEYTRPEDSDADTDCTGQALKRRAFVVNGVGGELRYNENTIQAGKRSKEPLATLVVLTGSGGTGWRDYHRDPDKDNKADDNDYRALELKGIRVVAVKWQEGVFVPRQLPRTSGWMSRNAPEASSFPEVTKRPAAIFRYVAKNLSPEGAKFGIFGSCGGSLQTASIFWHDIETRLDYAGLYGGGGLWFSLPHQCGIAPTSFRVNKTNGEVCERGDECEPKSVKASYKERKFAGPIMVVLGDAYVDYVHQNTACEKTELSSLHEQGSFLWTDFAGTIPEAVGFVVDSGPNTWPHEAEMTMGNVWAAGMMRELVHRRTGVLGDWVNAKGNHGQAVKSGDKSFRYVKQQVLKAFGL